MAEGKKKRAFGMSELREIGDYNKNKNRKEIVTRPLAERRSATRPQEEEGSGDGNTPKGMDALRAPVSSQLISCGGTESPALRSPPRRTYQTDGSERRIGRRGDIHLFAAVVSLWVPE
jgi:hypothetical protein